MDRNEADRMFPVLALDDHTSHYYVDAAVWDRGKVTKDAQLAASRTAHVQLIHPHGPADECGDLVHIRVLPDGDTVQVQVR